MKRVVLKFLLATSVIICIGGCALGLVPLSADPIDSRVVDIDTGAPIEGAVVLAYWELHSGSLSGDALPCGAANVEDAVTDQDGAFHLPGWGPIMPGCSGTMRQGNPQLYVFKPGYYFVDVPNGIPDTLSVVTTHNAWRNQPIPLKKIRYADSTDTRVEDWKNLNSLEVAMSLFMEGMPAQCNWKKAPHMMRAVALQDRALNQDGRGYFGLIETLAVNDQWFQKMAPQCGSPKAFIEELMK